jgi:ribonuclease BN (tRNA processing enzyme)
MMKLTVIGCGDAWGSAGRHHACFRLDAAGQVLTLDFGASSIVGWHRLGMDPAAIDVIVISHLHGDHFGGLPFLLMNAQYHARREKPLLIIGPPDTRRRLEQAMDVFYPGVAGRGWRFDWRVDELEPGGSLEWSGLRLSSTPVRHGREIAATALRVDDGKSVFAYSGDTSWTDDLVSIADGADLFVVECYSPDADIVGHINWPVLRNNLPRLKARRIAVTHMSAAMRARSDEVIAAGAIPLDDGMEFDF